MNFSFSSTMKKLVSGFCLLWLSTNLYAIEDFAITCKKGWNETFTFVSLNGGQEAYYEFVKGDSFYYDDKIFELKYVGKLEEYSPGKLKGFSGGLLFDHSYIPGQGPEKFIVSPTRDTVYSFKDDFKDIVKRNYYGIQYTGCKPASLLDRERITDLGRKYKGMNKAYIETNRRPLRLVETDVRWRVWWATNRKESWIRDKYLQIKFTKNGDKLTANFEDGTWDRYRGKYAKINGRQFVDKGVFYGDLIGNKLSGFWVRHKKISFQSKRCDKKKDNSRYWGRLEIEFLGPIFLAKWGECEEAPIRTRFVGDRLPG